MTAWDDMFVVARVARAHGNRGQVILDPATDFPEERFKAGSTVVINRSGSLESLTIESVRFHRGRPIVSLSTVATMNDAEALAGHELRIEPVALQPLPGGSFYHHDLIGCRVETATGQVIGTVTAVEGDGARSRLVVTGSGNDVLIPLVEGICVSVDVARGTIVVDPPEGLLELNEAGRQRL